MVNNHRSHCPDSRLWDPLQRQAGGRLRTPRLLSLGAHPLGLAGILPTHTRKQDIRCS